MRVLESERVERVRWRREFQGIALAVEAPEHGVGELARTQSVAPLRELHGLRDRGIGGHAAHVQQLKRAQAQQIEQIGVESRDTIAHALVQERIDARSAPQHSVDELACPSPVAGIEVKLGASAALERLIEQLSRAEIGAN